MLTETDKRFQKFLRQFLTSHRFETFERILQLRTRHFTVVLEDLFQSRNASACLRSCDCFGIQDLHVIENVNRFEDDSEISLGASQWLTIHRHRDGDFKTEECYRKLRENGYRIVATTPRDNATLLANIDVTQKSAFVFGTEMQGLSQVALEEADERLRIPLYGFSESLNISVSVALCLHDLIEKLHATQLDWGLREEEKEFLRFEWTQETLGKRIPELEREFTRRERE